MTERKFYEQFGHCLKREIHQDFAIRSEIELLRFNSSRSGDNSISLKEYVERM